MAKKKKSHKKQHKQNFAKARSTTPISMDGVDGKPALIPAVVSTSSAKSVPSILRYDVDNIDLIRKDVRRVVLLASAFVVLQLVLWVLFENTGLGAAVYNFVKL